MPNSNFLIRLKELIKSRKPGFIEEAKRLIADNNTEIDLFHQDPVSLFELLIFTPASAVLMEILKKHKNIDFRAQLRVGTETLKDRTMKRTMSWLQYACQYGDPETINAIKLYMEQNFGKAQFDMREEINKKFYHRMPARRLSHDKAEAFWQETTLPSVMLWTLSIGNMVSNLNAECKGEDRKKTKRLIDDWLKNREPSQPISSDTVVAIGPVCNMKYLMENSLLDIYVRDHNSWNLEQLAKKFNSAMQNPEIWNSEFKDRMILQGIAGLSEARLQDNRLVFTATLNNLSSQQAQTFNVSPALLLITNKILERLVQPQPLHTEVETLKKRVNAQQQQVNILSKTADAIVAQIKENLKDDPTYLEIFNNLCIDLSSLLTLKRAAKLGILKMQNSVKGTEHLQNINSLMAPFFEGISPGAVAIPMAINALLDMVNEIESKEQAKQLSAIQTDPRYLAIAIAVTLTEGLKRVYGNNPPKSYIKTSCLCWSSTMRIEDRLVNDVKAQLTTMGEFGSFHDAIAHLSAKAMKTIPTLGPVAPSTPQASSSSSASNDSKAQLATLRL